MDNIILIGCGGHAKSIIDSIESEGKYHINGLIDIPIGNAKNIYNYNIVGTDDDLVDIFHSGIKYAFISIGFIKPNDGRMKLYQKLKKIGYILPTIIDPTAVIAHHVSFEDGIYIGKRAIINAGSVIGKMSIINTGAIIEHENIIGTYSHISVGATLCGNVNVGSNTLVGAGSTIIQNLCIGDNCIIGAGSVVCHDVISNNTIVGVPGKRKR